LLQTPGYLLTKGTVKIHLMLTHLFRNKGASSSSTSAITRQDVKTKAITATL